MNFELLLWLIGAHFIGDFALQSTWMASMKEKHWSILLAHVIIWTTIICIPLKLFGVLALWQVIFLCIGHYAADWGKMKMLEGGARLHLMFYVDQMWHLLQLVVVVCI